MSCTAENRKGDGSCSCSVSVREQGWELFDSAPELTEAARALREKIAGNFHATLIHLLGNESCTPFAAPSITLDEGTVVHADVCIVCDPTRITATGIVGAPELVIDIVPPATTMKAKRDRVLMYERSGVREYLVVDPEHRVVERFTLVNGRYGTEEVFGWGEMLPLAIFPRLELNLWEILIRELPAEV